MRNQETMLSLLALRAMKCERRQPSFEKAKEPESLEDHWVQIRPGGEEASYELLKLPRPELTAGSSLVVQWLGL